MARKNSKSNSNRTAGRKAFTTVPKAKKSVKNPPVTVAASPKTDMPSTAPAAAVSPAIDSDTTRQLIAALRDSDADIAREAATSLGQAGGASAVESLIEVVANENGYFHAVVRSAAAASLGQLKDRRAVDALLKAIYDQIADSSSEAVRALAALGDPRAVSALLDVVRNHNGYFVNSVRRAAVLGLIQLGGEEVQAELRNVSANGWEDPVIREEATAALNVR